MFAETAAEHLTWGTDTQNHCVKPGLGTSSLGHLTLTSPKHPSPSSSWGNSENRYMNVLYRAMHTVDAQ